MFKGTLQHAGKWDLFAIIAILVALLGSVPTHAASSKPRTLFVWTMKSGNIYGNSTNQTTLFNFCAAPKGNAANAVTTIFTAGMLLSDFSNGTSVSQMQSFNSSAHSHGLTVYYTCGDPTWATTNQSVATQYVQAVLNYNASATAAQKFDGIMYDVEPWALSTWPKSATINGWLQMLTNIDNAIAASGQRLPLAQTLVWWIDKQQYSFCGDAAIDRINNGFIMDYTVNTSNFESFPANEISHASSTGKGIWIGAETNGPSGTTTWYSYGNAAMETCFSAALPTFNAYSAFLGYGIDDYLGYSNLIN